MADPMERANRERVLDVLRAADSALDDDEISARSGVEPRQTVNSIVHALVAEGVIERFTGPSGKLVNRLLAPPDTLLEIALPSDPVEDPEIAPGNSREQQEAETAMLALLGERLGVALAPRRLSHPSGAHVEVDGASEDLTVLVECWAHRGPAKVAQKYRLVNDALKLHWTARALVPIPRRLVLCVSDPRAVAHLRGRSWQGKAIADLGVDIEVVELPAATTAAIEAAQRRQFR